MDFMTNFPITESRNNTVMVVVDRLSKMAHFIPLRFGEGEADTIMVAKLLFDHIFKLHGLPREIISDRDPRFTSNVARQLCRHAGINQLISTTTHPETDGQSERTIQILEQFLRAYMSYQQND